MFPLRYLSVVLGTALVLGVGWWRSGTLRATALVELPSSAAERAAVRSMAELMIAEEELLLRVVTEVDLSVAPEVLAPRVRLVDGPGEGSSTLSLQLDFPGRAPFEKLSQVLVDELDASIRAALPEFRRERIQQFEERLRVLEAWLEGADGETQALIRGQREVLEKERDQALEEWNAWNLRESLSNRVLRLLTGKLSVRRVRAEGTPFVQLFFALAFFFAILEVLGAGKLPTGRSSRVRRGDASGDGQAPLPEMPASPPVVQVPEIRIPDFPPFPEIQLPETMHLELPEEVLERLRTPAPDPPPAPAPEVPAPAPAPEAPPSAVAEALPPREEEPTLPFRLLEDVPAFPSVSREVPDSYRLPLALRGGMPEPFPSLVAKLELLSPGLRVLQVAGWRSGLGGSLVAVNLARSLARLGRRVVLVDANLHTPVLDQVYRVDPDEGLSDVLLDCEPVELLHRVDEPAFHLLAAGPCPPAPEELLASPRFGAMIEELKDSFDVVVLDGPPLRGGADSLLLAARSDLVLPLVPLDVPLDELGREIDEWKSLGIPIQGVVSLSGSSPEA